MMILKVFANVISLFFFQMELTVTNIIYLAIAVLYIIGMYGVFRKCGLKSWHALIPCLREVQLGKAVGIKPVSERGATLTNGLRDEENKPEGVVLYNLSDPDAVMRLIRANLS